MWSLKTAVWVPKAVSHSVTLPMLSPTARNRPLCTNLRAQIQVGSLPNLSALMSRTRPLDSVSQMEILPRSVPMAMTLTSLPSSASSSFRVPQQRLRTRPFWWPRALWYSSGELSSSELRLKRRTDPSSQPRATMFLCGFDSIDHTGPPVDGRPRFGFSVRRSHSMSLPVNPAENSLGRVAEEPSVDDDGEEESRLGSHRTL
mmetsp:Transcript_3217/g.7500  ORF Transcript_3217/g.7500 Transcript_3217/m.7500 type:complete len:202 (+) Transcript_3217:1972-2577(+)